ncbi:unnamed protein product [Peniophora sp. CBMAI 1063]|nr:unnamed protein product [Peniophora sp. CBMAI 1063]
MTAVATRLRQAMRHNLRTLKSRPLLELSGAMGTLGVFLPSFATMVGNRSTHLSSTLLFTGLFNIILGAFFGLPIPVLPMGSATIRWYSHLEDTMFLSLGVSIYLSILSATGFLRWLNRITPIPVVKGVQISTGLLIILSAGEHLLQPLHWDVYWPETSVVDNLYWVLAAFVALIACERAPRVPYALIVVALGLVLAIGNSPLYEPPYRGKPLSGMFPIIIPLWIKIDHILFDNALSELPRTILTSIIATSHLAEDLLPDLNPSTSTSAPTATQLGVSITAMNLLGCWFGAMPTNLGVQGLAAQYRFGARTGAANIILGVSSLVLGVVALFSGRDVSYLLACIPKAFLGVMAVAVGVHLVKTAETLNTSARDLWAHDDDASARPEAGGTNRKLREVGEQEQRERWALVLVTVAGSLAFRSETTGFVVGMLWRWGSKAQIRLPRWWTRRTTTRDSEETRGLLDSEVSHEDRQ